MGEVVDSGGLGLAGVKISLTGGVSMEALDGAQGATEFGHVVTRQMGLAWIGYRQMRP